MWEGGRSPYATNSKKFGMWLFIISDSLTFSALLFAYTYSRVANPDWPTPFHFSPSIIFSTRDDVLPALQQPDHGDGGARHEPRQPQSRGRAGFWPPWPAARAFVVLHLTEWMNLINNEHVTPFSNPWGVPLFGGTFFALTGLHMTHVIIGVIYLGIICQAVVRGKFKAEDVEVSGLYWHFVDLVWMFIFPLVYLMSARLG